MGTTLVDQFIHWAERDRNRSPHTIKRYRRVLNSVPLVSEATVESIEAWWATRYDAAPATRENDLACLRTYYKWMIKFDHRVDDPSRRLDFPSVPNKVPRPISRSDLEALLGKLTVENLEVRRAVALGALGGLRVSEAASLDWANVDLESRRLYVRGKGAKERVSGLSVVLQDLITPNTGGNVVTAGKKAYSGPVLQRKINRFLQRNGMDNTFHDLRKRGATMAMARSKNPQAVAQVFGWASLQTVTHYALVGDEVLDEIADAMS